MKKNIIPKVAAIHDLSGEGRVSLYEVIAILSTMGIKVNSLPTAILSAPTSFKENTFLDLTEEMSKIINHWRSLKLSFDGIYTGFLGSTKQIYIVKKFIKTFSNENQIVLVDPVMADNGSLYKCFDYSFVNKMKELVEISEIITPNLTEAALLLGKEYKKTVSLNEIKEWLVALSKLGPKKVIITSIPDATNANIYLTFAYDRNDPERFWQAPCQYLPANYGGTGDAFTSVLLGALLNNDSLPVAIDRAVQFVICAIRHSFGHTQSGNEGAYIEKALEILSLPVLPITYEII